MGNYTTENLNIVEFLIEAHDNGIISGAQAMKLANMVSIASLETMEKKPNPKRVVNANRVKWETISGVHVVDCQSYTHWAIMNRECTRKLIENEIKKQRESGFSPRKVVIQGYRAIVKLESKKAVTPEYRNMPHGKLQASPFKGLQWRFSPKEAGFIIDLDSVK